MGLFRLIAFDIMKEKQRLRYERQTKRIPGKRSVRRRRRV